MKTLLTLTFLGLITLFSANVQALERQMPSSKEQIMLSYAPLVKKAAPAVVNIYSSKKIRVQTSPFLNDPLFGQFFGNNGLFKFGRKRPKVVNSLGSGVIVNDEGLIITNNHVVSEGSEIKIVLSDRREFPAKLVFSDPRTDLALLKIDNDGEKLPFLKFADSDDLEVGDLVLAIGNPFGVGQTVTGGIVSALARTTVGIADFEFFIQTDAAINPGNSGGALINMAGEIVGINTAIFSKSGGSAGIGFATPSNMAKVIIRSHESGGKLIRPWFGATTQDITAEIAESLGLKSPSGVLVNKTYPGSSASKAGLKTGDIITKINGHDVLDQESLKFRIATYTVGSKARLTVTRDGKERDFFLILEPPTENPPRNTTLVDMQSLLAGAFISNLSPALAEEMSINQYQGIIISDIQLRTPARRFFRTGDIILTVNGVKVRNVKQLIKLLKQPNRRWLIEAKRGTQVINVRSVN